MLSHGSHVIGGADGKGTITLKFDTAHVEWDPIFYTALVEWLAKVITVKDILRPKGSEAVWDLASQFCDTLETMKARSGRPHAAPIPIPQRDRPLKRPASAEPLVAASPPPGSVERKKSNDAMQSEKPVLPRPRPRPVKCVLRPTCAEFVSRISGGALPLLPLQCHLKVYVGQAAN